ncbi:hypothetical protein JCM8547_003458 [Rhodosporidiobolus lusitaniae]
MPLPRALSFLSLSRAASPASSSPSTPASPSSPSSSSTPANGAPPSSSSAEQSASGKKRRAQRKKKAQAARRKSLAVNGNGVEEHSEDDEGEDREADEDLPFVHEAEEDAVPEADDDESYLTSFPRPSPPPPPPDSDPSPSFSSSTPSDLRAAAAAAARRHALSQKALKTKLASEKKAAAAKAARLPIRLELPDGAGEPEGWQARKSTPEERKRLEQAGFVPVTDEKGMLRIGVRVDDETVLLEQKGRKEPLVVKVPV